MDRHEIEGVTAQAVVEAHEKDMAIQDMHGAKYLTYWLDEARGHIFCLCDAPSKEVAEQVHREAHGLVANQIIQVDPLTVEAFLGNIEQSPAVVTLHRPLDPAEVVASISEGLGTSAFRAIVFTDMKDSTPSPSNLATTKPWRCYAATMRSSANRCRCTRVRRSSTPGTDSWFCFASVSKAVECAIAILKAFDSHNQQNSDAPIHVKIGVSAGEPVEENHDFFGATVQLAARLCGCAGGDMILVSSVVRELCLGKKLPFVNQSEKQLKGFEQDVVVYEVDWVQA
jgi:class 3 adenylate cyclase